ncbi:MAG: hypothetical protein Q4E42_02500 [Phascolarctobacterium sp.]|nr:hypothetical protein [Phascolarctobacterium sp.]
MGNDISITIEDIHKRLQGKDWLKIEIVTEYLEMLGGKIRVRSVDLKYSCELKNDEKKVLEKSQNNIINNLEFDKQNELIDYVANYYAVPKENVKIVCSEIVKDHFD